MAYTGTTFAQLKNQLAERLNDNRQFWPDQELGLHLQDALRFWNILTGENRTNFSLPIQAGTVWYDVQQPSVAGFIGTRLQTTGGTNVLKILLSLGQGVANTLYTHSILIYNNGPTTIFVKGNAGATLTPALSAAPGQILQLSGTVFETGNNCGVGVPCSIQMQLQTTNVGDALDVIAINPSITANNGPNLLSPAQIIFVGFGGFSGAALVRTQGVVTPNLNPRFCTLTDQDVYLRLTYALLESPSNIGQLVTNQFVSDEIINAVQKKRDEFLFQTNCTSVIRSLPGGSLVVFPQSVIEAFRAYWLPNAIANVTPQPNPLFRVDDFALAAYVSNPGNQGQPLVFSAGTETPLTAQVIPPPNVPGNVEFITTETQGVLSQGNATTLLLPNDFIGALLWGALSDLLSQSLTAEDPTRAAIAKQRYEEYIALMDVYPFVMAAQANGVPIMVDAVENLDIYSPAWRTTQANPGLIGLSGKNLIALPTNQAMNINLFMVGNALIPVADGDFIQLGGEVLDVILDEAQSTASFKMGGAEAVSAFQLHGNIIKLAAKKNAKIRALSCFRDVLYGRVMRENRAAPKEVKYEET